MAKSKKKHAGVKGTKAKPKGTAAPTPKSSKLEIPKDNLYTVGEIIRLMDKKKSFGAYCRNRSASDRRDYNNSMVYTNEVDSSKWNTRALNVQARVFIYGAEVTKSLIFPISINREGRDSPNKATFSLTNVDDLFTIRGNEQKYSYNGGTRIVEGNDLNERNNKSTSYNQSGQNDVDRELAAKNRLSVLQASYDSICGELDAIQKEQETLGYNKASYYADEQLSKSYEARQSVLEYRKSRFVLVDGKVTDYKYIGESTSSKLEIFDTVTNMNALFNCGVIKPIWGNAAKVENAKGVLSDVYIPFANVKTAPRDETEFKSKAAMYSCTPKYKLKDANKDDDDDNLEEESLESPLSDKNNYLERTLFYYAPLQDSDSPYLETAKAIIYQNKMNVAKTYMSSLLGNPKEANAFYTFAPKQCIIEKGDPVRIFLKDPTRAGSDDGWIPVFTGIVDSVSRNTDHASGKSSLSISCSDIRMQLAKMRTVIAPTNVGTLNVADAGLAAKLRQPAVGMFRDILIGSDISGGGSLGSLAGKSIINGIAYLLCNGSRANNRKSRFALSTAYLENILPYSSDDLKVKGDIGLGNLSMGCRVSYPISDTSLPSPENLASLYPKDGPEVPQDVKALTVARQYSLEFWNDIMMFGGKCQEYSYEEVTVIGGLTYIGAAYSPYNSFMHILTPTSNGVIDATGLHSVTNPQINTNFEYRTRADMVEELLTKVDYHLTVNGMGDFMLEFPMYDFDPYDFGRYKNDLTINPQDTNSSTVTEKAQDIVTAMKIKGSISNQVTESMGAISHFFGASIYCPLLVAKYGVQVEEVEVPYYESSSGGSGVAGNYVNGKFNLAEQSGNKLIVAGAVEFQKRLANADTMDCEASFRIGLFPNRPVVVLAERRMGWIASAEMSIDKTSLSSSFSCQYTRLADEKGEFNFVGFGKSLPVSYRGNVSDGVGDSINGLFVIKEGSGAEDPEILKQIQENR